MNNHLFILSFLLLFTSFIQGENIRPQHAPIIAKQVINGFFNRCPQSDSVCGKLSKLIKEAEAHSTHCFDKMGDGTRNCVKDKTLTVILKELTTQIENETHKALGNHPQAYIIIENINKQAFDDLLKIIDSDYNDAYNRFIKYSSTNGITPSTLAYKIKLMVENEKHKLISRPKCAVTFCDATHSLVQLPCQHHICAQDLCQWNTAREAQGKRLTCPECGRIV